MGYDFICIASFIAGKSEECLLSTAHIMCWIDKGKNLEQMLDSI